MFMGGQVFLKKLWIWSRRSINEVEYPNFALFGIAEEVEDDEGKWDMVKAKNDYNFAEEPKEVWS